MSLYSTNMKKTLGLLLLFTLLLSGCESKEQQPKTKEVVLTQEEQKEVKNNPNELAPLLVRKAVLKEMANEKYTPEEQKVLDELKKNVEIEYFLNKKAEATTFVNREEAVNIYKENKSKFKGMSEQDAIATIERQIFFQRREAEKTKYLNVLIREYDLNNKIVEYYPKDETKKVEDNKKAGTNQPVTKEADKKKK